MEVEGGQDADEGTNRKIIISISYRRKSYVGNSDRRSIKRYKNKNLDRAIKIIIKYTLMKMCPHDR